MTTAPPDGPTQRLTARTLLGAEQGWLVHAHNALNRAEPGFLTPAVRAALGADKHRHRTGPDSMQWPLVWPAVGEPIDVVLRDLGLGHDVVGSGHLRGLLDAFEAHGLVTVGGPPDDVDPGPRWAEKDTRLQAAALAAATSGHPAGSFGALLVHVLAVGPHATRRGLPNVSMPVLLHNEQNVLSGRRPGEVGTLTLTAWPGGPPGLHPDPRAMVFSTVDGAALTGLASVMRDSQHATAGTCVTWAVRDQSGAPVRGLEGESLSAAVGLLLHELTPRRSWLGRLGWRVRPQRLHPAWTVTAGVERGHLTRVDFYDSKLEAVATLPRPLQVVAASEEAREIGRRHGVKVHLLETLDQVVAATRVLNKGFAAALVVLIAFAGVGVWAQQSVSAANLAAGKRSAAAELMQQARALSTSDPRLAALSALAADDLDPSLRTQEVMADVLNANAAVAGTAQVSSSYVRDVLVADNTLLVLDGRGQVTAWQMPGLTPLGTIVDNDARALGSAGSADAAVLVGSTLHLYTVADGYLPREVKTVETGLGGDAAVFGPYATYTGEGVVLLDTNLRGAYFDLSMDAPFQFSIGDDPVLEKDPNRRGVSAVAATPVSSFTEGYRGLATLFVATSSRQVVEVDVRAPFEVDPSPEGVVTTVMPATQARAAIRSLAVGPKDTLLLGTDRGVQWFDTTTGETKEYPYGGWSEQVDDVLNVSWWNPVVVGKNRIGFFEEPTDDRPRPSPRIVELDGSPITVVRAGDAVVRGSGQVPDERYVVGRENGTVILLDPYDPRFGPGALGGTNLVQFTPSGHLLLTQGATPQASDHLLTEAIPSGDYDPPADLSVEPVADPYEVSYNLPATNRPAPYINDAAASGDWVAASGRRSDGYGAIWLWHLAGGAPATEIPFGYGESGEDPVPDIAQYVEFVAAGRELVALNSARGELGFWTVSGWEQIGSISVPVYDNFEESGAVRAVASRDGTTMALRDSETTIQIIDVARHEIIRTLELPDASLTDLSISPDGEEIVVVDDLTTLLRLDATSDEARVLARVSFDAVLSDVMHDPDGGRLALTFPTASQVQLVDAETLEPLGPAWSSNDGYRVIEAGWSPDGEHLAVATMQHSGGSPVNGDTHILDAGMLTWRSQLCTIASSNFTVEEWRDLSGSPLPRPNSCDWDASPDTNQAADSPSDVPADNDDLTMTDVMAGAPVPGMCMHEAGTLVLGELPNREPQTGGVQLGGAEFGDLTGDGVGDAVAVVNCTAGGVSLPPWVVVWTRGDDGAVEMAGAVEASEQELVGEESSDRPVATGLTIEDGVVHFTMLSTMEGDGACCGSLPVEATLAVEDGTVVFRDIIRRYDVAALNQLLFAADHDFETTAGPSVAAPGVKEALAEFKATVLGVEAGTCADRDELTGALADRVSDLPADTGATRYCTVVGAPEAEANPLLLRLVPGEGERWQIVDVVP